MSEPQRATRIQKAPFKIGTHQALLLTALGFLLLCIYGALGLLMVNNRQPSTPNPRMAETANEAVSLSDARQQALALASRWQPDARLVGVTASWQLASGDRLTYQRPAWSFSFYSPAAGQMQMVTVSQAGAQATRQVAARVAPVPVQADWAMDSPDLLLTFMACGGEEFIKSHSQVNIHLQLKGQSDQQSTWYLTAIDPGKRQTLTVSVDALSRQIVSQG